MRRMNLPKRARPCRTRRRRTPCSICRKPSASTRNSLKRNSCSARPTWMCFSGVRLKLRCAARWRLNLRTQWFSFHSAKFTGGRSNTRTPKRCCKMDSSLMTTPGRAISLSHVFTGKKMRFSKPLHTSDGPCN